MFCLIFLPFVTIYGCNHVKIQTIEFSESLLVEEKLNYVQNSEQIQQW